jgi:hypothetical protein
MTSADRARAVRKFTVAVPSAEYATYETDDLILILHIPRVRNDPFNIDGLTFDTLKTCLIYAETIQISSAPLVLPSMNLGIFCSKLDLKDSQGTLSVAGADGPNAKNNPELEPAPGDQGSNGGNICLFVQNFNEIQASSLDLSADGGKGGWGAQSYDAKYIGGSGGDGGNAGKTFSFILESCFQ